MNVTCKHASLPETRQWIFRFIQFSNNQICFYYYEEKTNAPFYAPE